MKKSILAVWGVAALLCSCSSSTSVETESGMKASAFVNGIGNVNSTFSYYDLTKVDAECELYGFCGSEGFGRWSNGDTAIIDLKTEPKSEFTVKMCIDRVITPDDEAFVFDVLANNEPLTQISIHGRGNAYVNVPKSMVGGDGSVRLTLAFKNAALPAKYNPENKDGRKLGMAIKDITLYGYNLEEN